MALESDSDGSWMHSEYITLRVAMVHESKDWESQRICQIEIERQRLM